MAWRPKIGLRTCAELLWHRVMNSGWKCEVLIGGHCAQSAVRDSYGNTGDIERMDRPNGERGLYNYDVLHRLTSVSYNSGAHLNDVNYRYHYDNNGNRLAFQHEFGVDTVLYAQPNNQPTTHTSPATGTRRFTYDHKGNRVSTKTYASPTDADTAWTKSETYSYDFDDKLTGYVRVEKRLDGSKDTVQRRYLLDERGWRIAELAPKKGLSGANASDWETLRKWVYQGNYAVADSSEAGWTWYGRIGEQPIASAHVDTVTHKLSGRWWLTDHLGSVTRVENDTGGIVESISLDPYGNLESERGSEQVALTFTGKPRDAVSGMISIGVRSFDPMLGMWLGRDPMRQMDSPYGYGNPMLTIDPDGKFDAFLLGIGALQAGGSAIEGVGAVAYFLATGDEAAPILGLDALCNLVHGTENIVRGITQPKGGPSSNVPSLVTMAADVLTKSENITTGATLGKDFTKYENRKASPNLKTASGVGDLLEVLRNSKIEQNNKVQPKVPVKALKDTKPNPVPSDALLVIPSQGNTK